MARISNKQLSIAYYNDKIAYARGPLACRTYKSTQGHIKKFKENICQIYIRDGNLHRIENQGFAKCTLRDLEGKLEEITGKETIPFQKKMIKENICSPVPQPFVRTSRTMRYGLYGNGRNY